MVTDMNGTEILMGTAVLYPYENDMKTFRVYQVLRNGMIYIGDEQGINMIVNPKDCVDISPLLDAIYK